MYLYYSYNTLHQNRCKSLVDFLKRGNKNRLPKEFASPSNQDSKSIWESNFQPQPHLIGPLFKGFYFFFKADHQCPTSTSLLYSSLQENPLIWIVMSTRKPSSRPARTIGESSNLFPLIFSCFRSFHWPGFC